MRSPLVIISNSFRYFGSTGSVGSGYATVAYGVSFGFWKIKLQSGLRAESAGGGSADWWWLRSPHVSSRYTFRCIPSSGSVGSGYAGDTYGVSFGFCKQSKQAIT